MRFPGINNDNSKNFGILFCIWSCRQARLPSGFLLHCLDQLDIPPKHVIDELGDFHDL